MDELQQRRLARNESKYREVNENIRHSVDEFRDDDGGGEYRLLCECAVETCEQMIDVSAREYRRVREHAMWFFVVPEHVIDEIEHPVEQHDGYCVIEKDGPGRIVAKARDPHGA